MKQLISVDKDDFLLFLGIIVFMVLVLKNGISWAVDCLLNIFVAITLFNWIRSKIEKWKKE